jgi:hypothetical protein
VSDERDWDTVETTHVPGLLPPNVRANLQPGEDGLELWTPWPGELVNWLCLAEGPEGASHPGTICIWFDRAKARWCGVLHNRVRSCSLFRSGETLGGTLASLSAALNQDPAGWRGSPRK